MESEGRKRVAEWLLASENAAQKIAVYMGRVSTSIPLDEHKAREGIDVVWQTAGTLVQLCEGIRRQLKRYNRTEADGQALDLALERFESVRSSRVDA